MAKKSISSKLIVAENGDGTAFSLTMFNPDLRPTHLQIAVNNYAIIDPVYKTSGAYKAALEFAKSLTVKK